MDKAGGRRAPPHPLKGGPQCTNECVNAMEVRHAAGLRISNDDARTVYRRGDSTGAVGFGNHEFSPALRFFVRILERLPDIDFFLERKIRSVAGNVSRTDML